MHLEVMCCLLNGLALVAKELGDTAACAFACPTGLACLAATAITAALSPVAAVLVIAAIGC